MQSDSKMYGAADTEAQAPSQEKKALGRKTIAAICLAAALSGAAAVSVARGRAGVANLYIKTVPLELDCRADCCCDCCGFTGDDCSGGIQGDICAFRQSPRPGCTYIQVPNGRQESVRILHVRKGQGVHRHARKV